MISQTDLSTYILREIAVAECATPSIRFAATPQSPSVTQAGCDTSLKSKVNADGSIASEVKKRLIHAWWWILGHCFRCARRMRLTSATEMELHSKGASNSGVSSEDGVKKYWGPLIGHGDNGPSAKPLFTAFKTEGHVSNACLWHACRAVTIGSLLIIMGITMAVLGE